MKKILIAAALFASAFISTSAMAQAYVSGDIGTGHANFDCDGATSCKKNDTAFKITGGWKLGSGFSAEVGYIDFGKTTASDSTTSVKIKPTAWTLGAAYEYNFTPEFAGTVRLGVASVKTKVDASIAGVGSGSDSDTKTEAYYGLGVNYAIVKNVKLEAAVDFSRLDYSSQQANVRAITVGVRYDF